MKLASQQHQHEAGNLQHEAGKSTTSTGWSWHQQHQHEAGWHGINNINTKLEIFSMRLASQQHQARSWKYSARGWHQQHQHEAGNIQH
jgi:hypothetical protein